MDILLGNHYLIICIHGYIILGLAIQVGKNIYCLGIKQKIRYTILWGLNKTFVETSLTLVKINKY